MRQKTSKAELLDWIYLKFRNRKFVKSEIIGTPLVHFIPRLNKLKNSGWLNSQKISLKAHKDNRNYYLSSKAKKYLWKFGSFTNPNGPLMKEYPKKIYIEKPIEKKESYSEEVIDII